MRYRQEKPEFFASQYGATVACPHPLYDRCTLYLIGEKGLAVIQQRFDAQAKRTYWTEIDPWLTDSIYLNAGFYGYFQQRAGKPENGCYPTVTVRQILWALRMKPIPKERWETVFDRKDI